MPIINNKSKIFSPEKKLETFYLKGDRWVRLNGIRVDPIGDLLRHKGGLGITGIRRPFKQF